MSEVLSVGGSAALGHGRWRPPTSKLARYYQVADRLICFAGIDEPVLKLAHDFVSGYYFTPADSPDAGEAPAHLIAIHKGSPPNLPARESGFEIEDGHCYPNDGEIVLEVNGSVVLVGSPECRRTDVWLSETTAGRHPLALNNVILYAVQSALRRAGLYQFHAGCVVAPETESAMLIVGDSGSGKSTLTFALMRNGWRFVSDDNLILSETADGIRSWALRRYFTFDERTLSACRVTNYPESIGGRLPGDAEKVRFYARRAFPGKFVDACLPGIILFPRITEERTSRIEPMKQADALARLIRQCPWAMCDSAAAPGHLRVLSALTRQTKSYSFFAGKDVIEDPASIPKLLAAKIAIQ